MIIQTIAFCDLCRRRRRFPALLVVANRNPVYSVLFLILTFFNVGRPVRAASAPSSWR